MPPRNDIVLKVGDGPMLEMPNGKFRDAFLVTDRTGMGKHLSAGLVWFAPHNTDPEFRTAHTTPWDPRTCWIGPSDGPRANADLLPHADLLQVSHMALQGKRPSLIRHKILFGQPDLPENLRQRMREEMRVPHHI